MPMTRSGEDRSGRAAALGEMAKRRAGPLLYSVLVLAAVILALGLSAKFRRQWDLSVTRENVLSPLSRQALASLAEDVNLTALFTAKEPRREGYLRLLMQFQLTSPRVKVEFVDPVSRPGIVKELGLSQMEEGQRRDGMTVVTRGARRMVFRGVEEEDVTNAILEVGTDERRVVGFLRGVGERDPASSQEEGMSKAAEALRQEYYEIRDVPATEEFPPDLTVLVVAGPSMPVPQEAVERLARWLGDGGRLLALIDPGPVESGLEPVLKSWGLRAEGMEVLDPRENFNRRPEFLRVTDYGAHPIASGFGKNLPTAFPVAQSVSHFEPADPTVYHDDVARTGRFAIRHAADGSQEQGSFGVAVASWKRHATGRIQKETRVVLVGDSDFASNLYLPAHANRNFFLNCMGWLAREQGLVSIRHQPLAGQRLEFTMAERRLTLAMLLTPPLLVVLAGILVSLRRRGL